MRTRMGSSRFFAGAAVVLLIAGFAACSAFTSQAKVPGTGDATPPGSDVAAADPTWTDDGSLRLPSPSDGVSAGSSQSAGTGKTGSAATPGPGGATKAPVGPTPAHTPAPATPAASPPRTAVPGSPCYVFPASNVWHADISRLSVASNSTAMVNAIGRNAYLHPDFDAIGDGIPYNLVTSATPTYTVTFQYADESDPGPYPIPASPRIEGGSDRHLIAVDVAQCKLWELYHVQKVGSRWTAGSGAYWDLRSNALRPEGWTSADAAGLPILPGLVQYSEVMSGSIEHAIRFTAPDTCGYIYPARHLTADPCSNLPPMGMRFRLKASVDISGFGPHAQVVLKALKKYGMILADNGSPWYIGGVPDNRWNDDEFHQLQNLTGADFEAVNTSGLRNG